MKIKNYILSVKEWINRLKYRPRQDDNLLVILPGFIIRLKRSLDIEVPHEVTVVVPRAEVRKKCLNDDCSKYELEMIYSNITVVHAPRHRPSGSSRNEPESRNHQPP
ncbi:MAG: hypothetical protein PWQ97_1457 [Tepidanaerobacteraceae bacterium]|nr:hypothetical protein [Tepidanaerobacteraceae bacterium]